jgi:hypothetical protein
MKDGAAKTDALSAITQRIEDGFVVNEHGRWLYMAEQRIYERRVIEQIVNGNVLVDGKWVAIGEARRLALRSKAAARRQAAQTQASVGTQQITPPAPVTPLAPPSTETSSFEAVGDMLETICIDMSPMMKQQQTQTEPTIETTETAENADYADYDDEPQPSHIDSVLIFGLSNNNSAANQSRYAMAYIDELNISRKRSGMFGKLAKLSIALAAAAAAVLVVMHYVD